MPKTISKPLSQLLRTYYLGPDHPMKLRLWRWVRKTIATGSLTLPYDQTGNITLDETDWVQRHIFTTGFYEPEVWNTLSSYAAREEVVWDVGAHIGSFAVRAMLDRRVKEVHTFEPDPANRERLVANLRLNVGRYSVHPYAMGSTSGIAKLHRGPSVNTGLTSLISGVGTETFYVECRSADDLVFDQKIPSPTLMKIDVEGWESEVFKGARMLLAEAPPKAIVFEADCDQSGQAKELSLLSYLEGIGYTICRIERPSGMIEHRENYLARYSGSSRKHKPGFNPSEALSNRVDS